MPQLESFADLLDVAAATGQPLDAIFLEQEAAERELPAERIFQTFLERWAIMKDSVRRGLAGGKSFSGLVGGDAKKVIDFTRDGDIAGGRLVAKAIAYSIAVLEENSRMGIIVAAPTAGAAGMVPGTLLAISEERGLSDVETTRGLVVAGGFGALVAAKAELSGAAGGCQAEQGVGAAMAAGALAFLLGGHAGDERARGGAHAAEHPRARLRPGRRPRRGPVRRAQRVHGDARPRRARRRRSPASRA